MFMLVNWHDDALPFALTPYCLIYCYNNMFMLAEYGTNDVFTIITVIITCLCYICSLIANQPRTV